MMLKFLKERFFLFILIILGGIGQTVNAQVYGDSITHTYESAVFVNPYEVYKLSMVKYLSEKKNLPKDILKYKNCKILYLSAPTKKIVKGKAYYGDSKLKDFPTWINELQGVQRIEILGNPSFKFEKELVKLKDLKNLKFLEIEISQMTDELVIAICELKNLKSLVISSGNSISEQYLHDIQKCLPDCQINFNE